MKLAICLPILNNKESTMETLESFISNAKYPHDLLLILVDNGSNPKVSDWTELIQFSKKYYPIDIIIIRNEENKGVTYSLNQGYVSTLQKECWNRDYILYTHNDVLIQEKDWDLKIYKWLDGNNSIGVIGFGGAKGLGSPDIYKVPYNIWQLARFDFFSNLKDAEIHGRRMINEFEPCVTVDGFVMIVNTNLLKETNGFDIINYPVHHNYDNDICVESINRGYHNFVLNVACHHKGGMTATHRDYDSWLKSHNIENDSKVHEAAHVAFYNKWKDSGLLPLRVK